MFGSTARTVLTQSGGKEVGRNLKFQATRVCAVNCFSATHSRTLHPSDSPPQRYGSSCPSGARKRAPKSMPASPASRASEDDETVFHITDAPILASNSRKGVNDNDTSGRTTTQYDPLPSEQHDISPAATLGPAPDLTSAFINSSEMDVAEIC